MGRAVKDSLLKRDESRPGNDPAGNSRGHPDHRGGPHVGQMKVPDSYDPDEQMPADLESELYKHGGRVTHHDHYASGGKAAPRWIQSATQNKGALHRQLHVPEGQKIPAKKLEAAAHSSNPLERKRANLAKTLKGFKK